MKTASLQHTLKESAKVDYPMGYYCHQRDTIFVCEHGKIIDRLAGWQMPYFINKYVKDEVEV